MGFWFTTIILVVAGAATVAIIHRDDKRGQENEDD